VLLAKKQGLSPTQIMRDLGISKTSYYRILEAAGD